MTDDKDLRITEQANARFQGVDQWPAGRVLSMILDDQMQAVAAIRNALPQIERAVQDATTRLSRGKGRIVYMGAGTPIRIGVQDGVELTPTFGWPRDRLAFVVAGGKGALTQAVEGAEDDETAAERMVDRLNIGPADVCIAISASGTTPFTRAACRAARRAGALTIGMANNANAPLLKEARHGIYLDSGPEPVGGSTRMNAGTVQKIVLNMISTVLMNNLGHVYDGLMVDMKLNNAKLRQRAERMVAQITGCSHTQAAQALDASGKGVDANVKLAVLIVKGFTPEEGRKALERKEGNLRAVLDSLPRVVPLNPERGP